MALDTKPDNLRDEWKAACEFRDRHLKHQDDLIDRFAGRYYRSDRSPDRAITENFAYEFMSIMVPSVMYDNPRCRVRAADPSIPANHPLAISAFGGVTTMGQMASGIELALNRWSNDDELSQPLIDMLVSFYFSWAVAMVTTADQPGYSGAEMAPQKPYLIHLDNRRFVIDAAARKHDPMQAGGPRWMGHQWRADKEDLLDDPRFNQEAVRSLVVDDDTDEHDSEYQGDVDVPDRGQVVAYDIWVPEDHRTDEPGFNGTIHTVGTSALPSGQGKNTYPLRDPRPAYCPPWGPYTIIGAYKVPHQPYPLSPLVAVAEQAEEVNAHTTAAAEDAKRYKRFSYSDAKDAADSQRIVSVRHGEHILLDNPETFGSAEVGGVSDAQYNYNADARRRLRELTGLGSAITGSPEDDTTATAESIAKQGLDIRTEGLAAQYRRGVARIFKTAAHAMFYGEDQVHRLGEEGVRRDIPIFRGGVFPGREHFDFFDLSLWIDPMSMQHVGAGVLQQRVQQAVTSLVNISQAMPAAPWVRWQEPIRALFESLNIGAADEWVDMDMLQQVAQAAQGGSPTGGVGAPQQQTPDMRIGPGHEQQQGPTDTGALAMQAMRSAAQTNFTQGGV